VSNQQKAKSKQIILMVPAWLSGILFEIEDGRSRFFRNVGKSLPETQNHVTEESTFHGQRRDNLKYDRSFL
jgi:hypothetical protein